MSIVIERPGLATLVEGAPRCGWRHRGVPAAGAADRLSLALANRLVGNALDAAGLEATLSGVTVRFETAAVIAVTGADCELRLDADRVAMHERLAVRAGARLDIGSARHGARSYLAVAGGIDVPSVLGSPSTYVPARLGGLDGRALTTGDRLGVANVAGDDGSAETPVEFRLHFGDAWTLRATRGSEFDWLDEPSEDAVFGERFLVSAHSDRMGVALDGPRLASRSTGQLDSTPVFPGTLQCPESGRPTLLGVDAQTTGGYPRIAEVIRADRYLIGQLRPGCQLRFLERTPELARRDFANSLGFWREWLPDVGRVL